MAQTAAQVQAVLGTSSMNAQILRNTVVMSDATYQEWFCIGNCDAPGRARWVITTASDSAATQGAAILTALRV